MWFWHNHYCFKRIQTLTLSASPGRHSNWVKTIEQSISRVDTTPDCLIAIKWRHQNDNQQLWIHILTAPIGSVTCQDNKNMASSGGQKRVIFRKMAGRRHTKHEINSALLVKLTGDKYVAKSMTLELVFKSKQTIGIRGTASIFADDVTIASDSVYNFYEQKSTK